MAALELLLSINRWMNSAHCPLLQVCVCTVCVCVCPLLQVYVCVCTWMGQMQRTHFTAGYTLYNYVCDKTFFFFLQNRYPIVVKCLNIGKNIGTPIYRSISNTDTMFFSSLGPVSTTRLQCKIQTPVAGVRGRAPPQTGWAQGRSRQTSCPRGFWWRNDGK